MDPNSPAARRVRFGVFDFDLDTRELRREGIAVRLQAQPAQVLAALLENAGEVVTREQLRQTVWGADTYVDFEGGLNYCIAQIRAALGDSAESPLFVRTVPKRGYQFLAPVAPVAPVTPAPRTRVANKYLWAGAAAIVCGIVVVAFAVPRRTAMNIAVARFDNETGSSEMDSFADGLTDSVVAELTTAGKGRFGIIGNAAILRQPRSQRDLRTIGSSLKAGYVILGQVQRNASHTRVLAHLIRLPQQTHVSVVRFDRDITDPLATETELAQSIAGAFSRRLGN